MFYMRGKKCMCAVTTAKWEVRLCHAVTEHDEIPILTLLIHFGGLESFAMTVFLLDIP